MKEISTGELDMKLKTSYMEIQKEINRVLIENNLIEDEGKRNSNETKAFLKAAF